MRAAAHVVWEMNDRECALMVAVDGAIRMYVEYCEATRDCLWFFVQRFGGISCCLMLMVVWVTDRGSWKQKELDACGCAYYTMWIGADHFNLHLTPALP